MPMGFFVSYCPDAIELSFGLSVKTNLNPNPKMNLRKNMPVKMKNS